jgi:hypothetical protein
MNRAAVTTRAVPERTAHRPRARAAAAVLCVGVGMASSPCLGQYGALVSGIGDFALHGVTGRAAVNVASGTGNAQSNQAALAPSGTALAHASQHAGIAPPPDSAASHIGQGVFAGASGLLSANLASGNGNLQSNVVAIAPAGVASVELVSDGLLASASSHGAAGHPARPEPGRREAVVHPHAYRHASGLVQLNQTAGAGNASSNVFVLRPPAGTMF